MIAATMLYEGTIDEVKLQEKQITEIAMRHHGLDAGEENGLRGYILTFVITYIRDMSCNYKFVTESFETTCPWDKVS
jgi:alkyldihydroxyacetonephosphate synthase